MILFRIAMAAIFLLTMINNIYESKWEEPPRYNPPYITVNLTSLVLFVLSFVMKDGLAIWVYRSVLVNIILHNVWCLADVYFEKKYCLRIAVCILALALLVLSFL